MSNLRVTSKTTVEIRGTQTTVGELVNILADHDPGKRVWIRFSPGRDPREYDTIRLEIG